MSKAKSKNIGFLAVLAVLMIGGIGAGVAISSKMGKSNSEISREKAMTLLDKRLRKISVTEVAPRKATVEIAGNNLAEELPDIEKYPLSVTGRGTINLEIFSSTEKSSGGTDGWLNEIAEKFNSSHYTVNDQWATVSVRPIASGAAIDYIISGKHVPEAYSPSNELWGEMVRAENVRAELIEKSLAGNTAGILVSRENTKI